MLFGCGEEEKTEPQEMQQAPVQSQETAVDTVQKDTTANMSEDEAKKTNEMVSSVPETYEVQEGETLTSIAEKFYGDSTMWFDIFAANEGDINNWNKIYPGQELEMVEPNNDN